MTQPCLFDRQNPMPAPAMLPAPERARLSAQCQRILARLEIGPATNGELSLLALKYTGRVSDLRAAGYLIECYDRDRVTGVSWYRLRRAAAGGRP